MSNNAFRRPGTRSTQGLFCCAGRYPRRAPRNHEKHILTGAIGTAWANIITGIIYVYFGNATV